MRRSGCEVTGKKLEGDEVLVARRQETRREE